MAHEPPYVYCLCPTFGRKMELLENTIECFRRQTYPAHRRHLFILEDSGRVIQQTGESWVVESVPDRYPSLPAKYNAMRQMVGARKGDIILVWEDDDLYLPHHINCYVLALAGNDWAHPSRVWSTYVRKPTQEEAAGRFHAALGFWTETLNKIGGWEETRRADFDQRLIATLRDIGYSRGDPNLFGSIPSYVFRWGDTGHSHGEAFMAAADDEDWYQTAGAVWSLPLFSRPEWRIRPLKPALDAPATAVFEELLRGSS